MARRINVYTDEYYPQEHGFYRDISTSLGYLIGTVVGQEIIKRRYKKEILDYYEKQRNAQEIEEGADGQRYFKEGSRYLPVLPEYDVDNMGIPELHRLATTMRYAGMTDVEFQKKKQEMETRKGVGEALEKTLLYTIERQAPSLNFTDALQWYSLALALSERNPRVSKLIIEKLNEVYEKLLSEKKEGEEEKRGKK